MGTGGAGVGRTGTSVSLRDRMKEAASSLIRMASSSTNGLKAVLAEMKASGDKVVASLPGRSNQEVPNKDVKSILSEGVKFSDILKIVAGMALSTITGNPIPLLMAERHANNLSERIKAKEQETKDRIKQEKERIKNLNTQVRDAKRDARSKASIARLNKNDADYRQLMVIRGRINAKIREARLAVKRAERQASKKVSDIDKNLIRDVKSAFVKLGYKPTDAKRAAEIALTKTNDRDVTTIVNLAIREAASLANK